MLSRLCLMGNNDTAITVGLSYLPMLKTEYYYAPVMQMADIYGLNP